MCIGRHPAHEEGGKREWAVQTKAFIGDDKGHIKAVRLIRQEVAEVKNGKTDHA